MCIIEALNRQLDKAVRDPANTNAINAIGVMLYQLGDLENAQRYLQRAYCLDSLNIDYIYNYSRVLYDNQKYQEVIEVLKPCFEKRHDPEIIIRAADCYYMMGDYSAADKLYEKL